MRANSVSTYQQIEQHVTQLVTEKLASRYAHAYEINVTLRIPKAAHSLPKCDTPLAVKANSVDVGRTRIYASCSAPSWRLKLSANSTVKTQVLVASNSLSKGHRLQSSDYQLQNMVLSTPQKAFFYKDTLNGRKLKRKLTAGDVITSKHLELEYAVKKDDTVTIFLKSGTFSLTTEGIAEQSAVLGDTIKIRNKQSGKQLIGTVIGTRQVEVR